MAGDWIKLENTTPDKPEVIRMASILRMDQDAVVGKLIRVWVWADQNSIDGNDITVTESFIDRLTSKRGFAAAMRSVKWLSGNDGAIIFPQFERHNGETAKARAESNRRMAKSRALRVAENLPPSPSKSEIDVAEISPQPLRISDDLVAENPQQLVLAGDADVAEKAQQKPQPEKRRYREDTEYQKTPIVPLQGTQKGPLQLRAEAIFRRRPDTPLTVPEERAFKKNLPAIEATTEADWRLLEAFYAAPQSETFARKDLATLVNNWNGEIDRARAWPTRSAKRVGNPYQVKATTDEEHAKGF